MPNVTELHIPDQHDLPPVVLFDRRRCPDRRAVWRGGRRDSDWINRPPGALGRVERSGAVFIPWRRWWWAAYGAYQRVRLAN